MADLKPTLHHLNHSQSQRILWLLEELEIPYNLKLYERQTEGPEKGRAPKELKELHPQGKSPVLVTGDGRTIGESSAIALYLLKTFDSTGRFAHDDVVRDDELCSFAGTTIGTPGMIKLILEIITASTPSLARPLVRMLTGGLDNAMTAPELKKAVEQLEVEIGDHDWFMGDRPGRADFVLSWPFDILAQRGWLDLKSYPRLSAWRERIQARAAWKSALEKGNGYDLSTF